MNLPYFELFEAIIFVFKGQQLLHR